MHYRHVIPIPSSRRRILRRLAPLLVLALAAGCAKDPQADKPIDPSLHQATIEVTGMT